MTALPTMMISPVTFRDLFPPEPPTAPMPVEVVRYDGPKPPPPPPEAFEDEPVTAPAPKARRCGRKAKVAAPVGPDPRLPSNVAVHVWAADGLQRRTPAQRRKLMAACPCRLCALALRPALTFAEAEMLGLGEVGSRWERVRGWVATEGERAGILRGPRPLTRAEDARANELSAALE